MIDFGPTDMVPHVAVRKAHQPLQEFSLDTSNPLLSSKIHNLRQAEPNLPGFSLQPPFAFEAAKNFASKKKGANR